MRKIVSSRMFLGWLAQFQTVNLAIKPVEFSSIGMKKKFFIPHCPGGNSGPQFGLDKPWLAPLAGYSDLPFRRLCRNYGAATCVTEMVSAKGLLYQSPGTGELLLSEADDLPLVVQLFGADAESMGQAVGILARHGYAWFDCNMGCSVRKVFRQGAGASLLGDAPRALEIAKAMIEAVKTENPHGGVGFKLRLGLDASHLILPDLALRLEDLGAAWITLHPRYAAQGFEGKAQWDYIASLAERLRIPIIASGDLLTARDGMECLKRTGAAGVMYARGALRNPFIFSQHLALANGMPMPELSAAVMRQMIEGHLALARKICDNHRLIFKMRSIVPRYIRLFPGSGELRKSLSECQDWTQLSNILDEFFTAEQTD